MGLAAQLVHGGHGAVGLGRASLALAHHVGRDVLFVVDGLQVVGHAAIGPGRFKAFEHHISARCRGSVSEHQGLDVCFVCGGGLGAWQRQCFGALLGLAAFDDGLWPVQQFDVCLDGQFAA